MRILYVTQIVPYPPHGGVLQRGFNLLRELGRRHEVQLLAFHHPDELPPGEALDRSRQELGQFCVSLEYFDLWVKRSRLHMAAGLSAAACKREPFSVLAHHTGKLSSKLREICRDKPRPDIVHLDTVALAPYASNSGDVPVVLAHHNLESRLMQRRGEHEKGLLRRWYVSREASKLSRFETSVCARFRANIMVSEEDARALKEICPGALIETIPNGVDTDYFAVRREEQSPALIFTGGMNMFANRDGVDWFVESVWPLVKQRAIGTSFVAIGQRPSEKLLAAAARDRDIDAPGFVSDIRPAVARAAVYVVPLRVGGGTRLKVLDAMAQGKAIVSTSLGAEGLDVQPGKHLLVADTPDGFAARILELLNDPARRRSLGDAARALVEERYSWPTLAHKLAQVYERAIARGAS